jgi:hypothetical protein
MIQPSNRGALRWIALGCLLGAFFWLPLLYIGLAILVVSWFL